MYLIAGIEKKMKFKVQHRNHKGHKHSYLHYDTIQKLTK